MIGGGGDRGGGGGSKIEDIHLCRFSCWGVVGGRGGGLGGGYPPSTSFSRHFYDSLFFVRGGRGVCVCVCVIGGGGVDRGGGVIGGGGGGDRGGAVIGGGGGGDRGGGSGGVQK